MGKQKTRAERLSFQWVQHIQFYGQFFVCGFLVINFPGEELRNWGGGGGGGGTISDLR